MKSKKLYLVKSLFISAAALTVFGFFANSAFATNGYFSHGYGIKSKAMGGAGVALPLDSLTGSTNPAAMVFVGQRVDLAVSLFNPNRKYNVTGAPSGFPGTFGLAPGEVESDSKYFVIPSLGTNWMLESGNGSIGVSVFGNGGMNSDYDTNTFGGSIATGVDLAQLFIAPTYARKLNDSHSFGITPIIGYQRFEAQGLQQFAGFSSDGANLTNNGHDSAFGFGARIGYYGEITPKFSIGAAFQTKIYMSELDSYKGLFAEQGDFDIPANWTVGVAVKPTDALAIALDVQTILYSDVASISNPLLPNLTPGTLGNDGGAGFGWEDMTVIKIGAQYQTSPGMTWRAGLSYGEQPIPSSEMLFNILAPGVVETHATFGFTKSLSDTSEIDFSLMHAFDKTISGPNTLDAPGFQTIELTMNQWEATLGYSWVF